MSLALQHAIVSAPAGTSGLVCEPWTPGEVYGVAANWSEASACVYTFGEDGWCGFGKQVADYRHDNSEALADILSEALRMSGEDDAETQAARLVGDATEF